MWNGRRTEFESEVMRHLDAAYNLARWLLGPGPDAEDAVQDATLRALDGYARFRGNDSKPWFLAIVRNGCLNRIRQRVAQRPYELAMDDGWEPGGGPNPERLVIQAWEAEAIQAAVEALPVDHREILVLREFEELSYKQIAAVTDLPIGTVMSRLARARARLMAHLTETGGYP